MKITAAAEALGRAQVARQQGRWEDALSAYDEALEASEGKASSRLADVWRGIGIVQFARSDWEAACAAFRESREVARTIDDYVRAAKALNGEAGAEFERGHWILARQLYDRAYRLARKAGDRRTVALVENNRGILFDATGDHEAAEICFRSTLEMFEDRETHPCPGQTLNNLGLALSAQRRWEEAAAAYDEALHMARERSDRILAAKTRVNRARLELERGCPNRAHREAREAWEAADKTGHTPAEAGALCLMAEVSRRLGDHVGGIRFLKRALDLSLHRKAPLVEAEVWEEVGNLHQSRGENEEANDSWRHAQRCYRELGAEGRVERLERRIVGSRRGGSPGAGEGPRS